MIDMHEVSPNYHTNQQRRARFQNQLQVYKGIGIKKWLNACLLGLIRKPTLLGCKITVTHKLLN